MPASDLNTLYQITTTVAVPVIGWLVRKAHRHAVLVRELLAGLQEVISIVEEQEHDRQTRPTGRPEGPPEGTGH